MRGKISPTVVHANLTKQDWHSMYKDADSLYDWEGFDVFGYNEHGEDRAGFRASDYALKWVTDLDPWMEYDEGERLFRDVAAQWSYFVEESGLIMPACIAHYKPGFLPETPYIYGCTVEGDLKVQGSEHIGLLYRVKPE